MCLSLKDHIPIKIADENNKLKPRNSKPMLRATNKEYKMAVNTPDHSKILFKKYYDTFLTLVAFSLPLFSPISNETASPS